MSTAVSDFIKDILHDSIFFLGGIFRGSSSVSSFVAAVYEWARIHDRSLDQIIAGVEPSIRQSVLMSLIPAEPLRQDFAGSYDNAIRAHHKALGINLADEDIEVIRNIIINARKLRGLSSQEARRQSARLSTLKGRPIYRKLRERQNDRCCWCGVDLNSANVIETLEHVVPKHLGNDQPDGSNWALACKTCNSGKGDILAWSASAWAHDFLGRKHFLDPDVLEKEHRWVVLRRAPYCDLCRVEPTRAELFVYRKIASGLAIPANCSVTCAPCAKERVLDGLIVRWAPEETKRAHSWGS